LPPVRIRSSLINRLNINEMKFYVCMIKREYIIVILVILCAIVILTKFYPVASSASADLTPVLPDPHDPIIGNWIQHFPNGGYNEMSFAADGQWSWKETYNGGATLRSIPPWFGTWKRKDHGVYMVNQSGSFDLWDYNSSKDIVYPENATEMVYSRANSS
jgi:hypothetical protein